MASRRSILKAALGSAVGASVTLAPVVAADAEASPSRRSGPEGTATLRGVRRLGTAPRGVTPAAGDRCVVVADVVMRGRPDGVLHADVVRLHDRGQLPEHPTASTLEQHVLVWSDGTLTASGHCDAQGAGRFAITGGTGVHHGAAGSYDIAMKRSDLGGDGTGRIAFHMTTTHGRA